MDDWGLDGNDDSRSPVTRPLSTFYRPRSTVYVVRFTTPVIGFREWRVRVIFAEKRT